MKKLLICIFIFSLILVGCATTKKENKEEKEEKEVKEEVVKTIDSYSVNVKEVSNTITQIDTTAIHEKGNALFLNQIVDGKLYIDVRNSTCLVCFSSGGSQGYFAYNPNTQSLEETPMTKDNIRGLPFKDGVVSIDNQHEGMSYTENLIFTNDAGSNIIYSNNVASHIRVVIGKDAIFVGESTPSSDHLRVESEKVTLIDQTGAIIKEVDVPVKLSTINTNINLWFVSNDEVQTMDIPDSCILNDGWYALFPESAQLQSLYCSDINGFEIKGIDYQTKTISNYLPETMSDYFTFSMYDLEGEKQLVVSMKRDYFKEIQNHNMMAFDSSSMKVGIYDQVEKRYIPITDENSTLGQFFSWMPQTVRRESLTQSNYFFSSNSNQLAKLTVEDDVINFTFTSFDTQDYVLTEFIEKDDHLFFVTTPLSTVSVDYPEFGLVQISLNK